MGRLAPGTTKRRWEPEEGIRKHNEKIHRESKYVDEHKNLPFKFSKPKKPKRTCYVECVECGSIYCVPINTVGVVCKQCDKYVSTKEVS
jgi:hypothetical protein